MKKLLCLLCCLLIGTTTVVAVAQGETWGAWLPYWETDASLQEVQELGDNLDTLVAFASIFDHRDQPLMLPDAEALLEAVNDTAGEARVFLSIVNDVEVAPETYDNKSKELLNRLFADENAMALHLEALARLVDRYSLTGLELDYENLKADAALWNQYAVFIARAWEMCRRDEVALRVVLPWDAPKYVTLPQGPEYVVMCYNLYGYHSGEGPKADISFLQETAELYKPYAPNVRMAFATGGFTWQDGSVTALTQLQAEERLQAADVTAERDPASGALHATFEEDGKTFALWYADGQTLATWRDVFTPYGFAGYDLFRLGGNDLEDLSNTLWTQTP